MNVTKKRTNRHRYSKKYFALLYGAQWSLVVWGKARKDNLFKRKSIGEQKSLRRTII